MGCCARPYAVSAAASSASTLLAVGHQLSEAAVPVVVGVVLDRAVGTGDGSALVLWLAVVVGVFVVLASCGGHRLLVDGPGRAPSRPRPPAAGRRAGPGPAGGAPGRPGEQVGLASSDADRTARIVRSSPEVASALAALAAGAVVLFAASPWLALAVLVGVPLVLLSSRLLARPLVGRAEAEQATLAATTVGGHRPGHRAARGQGHRGRAGGGEAYARASRTALRARLAAVTAWRAAT